MTIALIEIPHQRPARINWYVDRDKLIDNAVEECYERGELDDSEDLPTFDEAVHYLSDDWNCHIVVETIAEIDELVVPYYGHQKHRVHAMAEELRAEIAGESA